MNKKTRKKLAHHCDFWYHPGSTCIQQGWYRPNDKGITAPIRDWSRPIVSEDEPPFYPEIYSKHAMMLATALEEEGYEIVIAMDDQGRPGDGAVAYKHKDGDSYYSNSVRDGDWMKQLCLIACNVWGYDYE